MMLEQKFLFRRSRFYKKVYFTITYGLMAYIIFLIETGYFLGFAIITLNKAPIVIMVMATLFILPYNAYWFDRR